MKESSLEKESIYIEEMHGFEKVTKDLGKLYGCDLIYGDIQTLTNSGAPTAIVGIVKGPRTKLTAQMFERVANASSNPIIGYIGRHPEKILREDVIYKKDKVNGQEILLVQAGQKEIPLLSMDKSPLSDAVAAYVSGMVSAILQGRNKEIENLTIGGGNGFNKRDGHSFATELNPNLKDVTLGVIGAGDVGSRVIDVFNRKGASIFYTDASAKPEQFGPNVKRLPGIEDVLHRPPEAKKSYVVSLHLPKGVKVPLETASGIDILVNTSSGSNIDEDELMRAIKEGRIGHAILDVFNHEVENFSNDKMSKHLTDSRLTITPHIAYNNSEAIRKTLQVTIDNIIRFRGKSKKV